MKKSTNELLNDIERYYNVSKDDKNYIIYAFKDNYDLHDLRNVYKQYQKMILNYFSDTNDFINRLDNYEFITIQEYRILKDTNEKLYNETKNLFKKTFENCLIENFENGKELTNRYMSL